MTSIGINIVTARKILKYMLERAHLSDDKLIISQEKKEMLDNLELRSRDTLRKYLRIFTRLKLLSARNNTYEIDLCNVIRSIFLFDIDHKTTSRLLERSRLLSTYLGNEPTYAKIKSILNENWSVIDSLFVLAYLLYKELIAEGFVLRDIKEKQVPKDLISHSDRIRSLLTDLCRWYVGDIVFPEYVIQEPFQEKSVRSRIIAILRGIKLKSLAFEDTLLITRNRKIVQIDLNDIVAKLDKNLFILILKAFRTTRIKRLTSEPMCIREFLNIIENSIGVFVALTVALAGTI